MPRERLLIAFTELVTTLHKSLTQTSVLSRGLDCTAW
jgi:hypothetical protein